VPTISRLSRTIKLQPAATSLSASDISSLREAAIAGKHYFIRATFSSGESGESVVQDDEDEQHGTVESSQVRTQPTSIEVFTSIPAVRLELYLLSRSME